jgi:FixJ family two-component response regulator
MGGEPSVAVVDDDLSVRRSIERLLRSAGYRVKTFASAREFLERAVSDRPDCAGVGRPNAGSESLLRSHRKPQD